MRRETNPAIGHLEVISSSVTLGWVWQELIRWNSAYSTSCIWVWVFFILGQSQQSSVADRTRVFARGWTCCWGDSESNVWRTHLNWMWGTYSYVYKEIHPDMFLNTCNYLGVSCYRCHYIDICTFWNIYVCTWRIPVESVMCWSWLLLLHGSPLLDFQKFCKLVVKQDISKN